MDKVEIKVPSLGESIVEATVARWLKNEGDFVRTDELIVEIETDKVTLEVCAPASGSLVEMCVKVGETVKVGAIVGLLDTSAKEPEQVKIEKAPIKEEAHLSPSVAKLVNESEINPNDIIPTGPKGNILKGDVLNYLNHQGEERASHSQNQESDSNNRLEKRVPMSRLRTRIAERLKEAQNTAAILTTFNEVDMSAVKSLRDRYKDEFEKKHGIKLGFMSFFVKACVEALRQVPMVNSRIEGQEIITCNYVDMAVAVSAPQGLVVPVLRNADQMDLATIEKSIAYFGKKARDGKLTLEEMSGGTFTISNGGIFGSLLSTPILNPPQSGILGMHKIQDRPVAIDGRIEIRPMMYLALSYDHRLIDGKDAVTCLVIIKECLENPGRFLLNL